jgi:hypothetical protein
VNKTIAELRAAKKVLEGRLRSAIAEFEAEYGIQCDEYVQVQRRFNNQGISQPTEALEAANPIERVRVGLQMHDLLD